MRTDHRSGLHFRAEGVPYPQKKLVPGISSPPPPTDGPMDPGTWDTLPLPWEQIDRRLWKDYLPATTVAGGN